MGFNDLAKKAHDQFAALEIAVQNRFETLFSANGSPAEMLLVAQDHGGANSTIWVRLADERYVGVFPEFAVADASDIPTRAELLVGHPAEFEQLFQYGPEG